MDCHQVKQNTCRQIPKTTADDENLLKTGKKVETKKKKRFKHMSRIKDSHVEDEFNNFKKKLFW